MKKLFIALTIMSISLFFVACSNQAPETKEDPNTNETKITVQQAKDIALKHANLTTDQVKFLKTEESMDDKIQKYDIEFYYDNKEYDYEIDVNTGEIIEYDNELEDYTKEQQPINNENKNKITIEQAKDIALKHANLKSDQVKFIKEENDTDNGKNYYDIEFTYDNVKYNYEVDANTGEIIEFGKE